MKPTAELRQILELKTNHMATIEDMVSTEIPISLIYNGISHVVLMATPHDLNYLAIGFSLSEGIITHIEQIYDIEVVTVAKGILINIELAAEAFQKLKNLRRNLTGRTGCGLCGLESLDALDFTVTSNIADQIVNLSAIQHALHCFNDTQVLRGKTGSVHGVAYADNHGDIICTFEDVGRHNALDKLIGWGMKKKINWKDGFVLISSRASFEMVLKSARAGVAALVAVSAPTSLAIDLALKANMTLMGFARENRQNIYTHSERILIE